MFNRHFKELYSRLFADLDNTLLDQYDLLLHEGYGLESDEEVVHYLASKLRDIESIARTAKKRLHVHYLHLPPTQITYSLLFWIEANAAVTRITLLRTLNIVTIINREYNLHLRVFEQYTMTDILAEMYQILEELGSFLYFRNGSDLHGISNLHLILESAISTVSHCIMILQSVCSQKIARDILDELGERLFREEVLEADEGFGEDPIIKQEDQEKAARERLLRDCINSSVIFSARRSTYILACCMLLCTPQYLSRTETERSVAEIYAITESLLTTSLLLAWHVPTRFRAMAAGVVADKSFAIKQQLSSITNLFATSNRQPVAERNAACDIKSSSRYCRFLTNSPPPCNATFKVLKSIVVSICDGLLFDAAHAYRAHADGRPISEFSWNVREPFKCHFIIFNLAEAVFLTHHILHLMELNLQKNVGKMLYVDKAYSALDACSLMMRTVTIASHEAVNLVKKAESDFDSALSTLCHLGGEDFVEKFLCISRSGKENNQLSCQDVSVCSRMYEVAQHVRNACYGLQSLKKYIFVLRMHDKPHPLQCINNVYLCCTRVFDTLLHEHYHDYAWNVSCKSTLPVLPGELPDKVDKYELLHDAPEKFFSSAELEEVLNPPILEKLKTCRDLEKQPPSTFLSSLSGVVQRVKDWLLHEEPCPSSQPSVASTTRLCKMIQECILRIPFVGTYITDVCCSKVHEIECRSFPLVNYRGLPL